MAMAARESATAPTGAGPGKSVPGTLTYRGADWFYEQVFVAGATQRVAAPLVSTLVFRDGRVDKWLFSTQSGHVAKKRSIALQAVGDSFRRVALAHESNDERLCAVLRMSDGTARPLNEETFDDFCATVIPSDAAGRPARQAHVVCAHAYVHSRGGDGAVWRHAWTAPPDSTPTAAPTTRLTRHPGELFGEGGAEVAAGGVQEVRQEDLLAQLDSITGGVVLELEARARLRVAHIELDFAIDQSGRLFLVFPHTVVTRPLELASRREAVAASARMAAGDAGVDLDSLPRGRRTLPAAASRGAGGMPTPSPVRSGSVSFEGGEGKEAEGKDPGSTRGVRDMEGYLRGSQRARAQQQARQRQAPDEFALRQARGEARRAAEASASGEEEERWAAMGGRVAGHGWRGAVLVAESDARQGLPAVEALVAEGFAVLVALDGPSALQATRSNEFSCALVATDLPAIGGVEATRILRQREQGVGGASSGEGHPPPRLPVVAFTAETGPEDLRSYMDAGLDGCVAKPLDVHALVNTLTTAVPEPAGGPPADWTDARRRQELRALAEVERRRADALAAHVTPGVGGLGGTPLAPIGSGGAGRASTRRSAGASGRAGAPTGSVPVSPMRGPGAVFESTDSLGMSGAAGDTRRTVDRGDPGAGGGRQRRASAPRGGKLPAMAGRDAAAMGPPMQPPPAHALPVAAAPAGEECEGLFQLDAETAIPYAVVGKHRPGAPVFHFVVCHDMFDTFESGQIFFRAVCAKYPGVRALLFNYPGQAFTEWRRDALLNNEYLSGCLQALLAHLSDMGTGEFGLDDGRAPFHLLGLGAGGAVATCFATTYHGHHPNMRSLVCVNGFSYVDSHLAGVMHDCMNVFACSPPSRPDLPVYFFSRFLFSPGYLAKVGAPLALNLYTAVNNPITLDGRIQLCQGLLSNVDCRDALEAVSLPVVCVVSSKDGLVKPAHVQAYVNARGGEERSLRRALKTRKRCCVVWLRSGHEVLQEARKPMTHLIEQLATGYHERHDVAFLPLAPEGADAADAAAGGAAGADGRSRASSLAHRAMAGATARASAHRGGAAGGAAAGLDASGVSAASGAPRMYEEKYLDSVVGAVKAARESTRAGGAGGGEGAGAGAGAGGASSVPAQTYQFGDAPAALATAPPSPPAPSATAGGAASRRRRDSSGDGGGGEWRGGSMIGRVDGPERAPQSRSAAASAAELDLPRLNLDPSSAAFETHETAAEAKERRAAEPAAEVKEYMQWRVRRNRKRLQRLEGCVVQIQRCWRAYLARTLVARMRQQRGALTVQRWWRGCMGRTLAEERRREIWAARVVQKYWRGHSGRQMAWQLQAEERAARSIQRSWRGWRARRFVDMLRNARHEAATRIQSLFRKRQAMRGAWELRDKHNAAINVQRVWRGFLGRARARKERDRYLFSKSQSQGIEFGRQMLLEHKLHGTKLQSEVSLLTKEKLETEEAVEAVLAEIATFEAGVRALEKEMVELSRAEAEAASTLDEESKAELRENKMRLDREFGEMLVKIADRREKLQALEKKLQTLDRTRQAKKESLADLERKLVVLLEEQQRELAAIKSRQASAGERLVEDAVAAVSGQVGGSAGGPSGALAITNGGGGGGGGAGGGSTALVPAGAHGHAMVPAGGAGAAAAGHSSIMPAGPSAQDRAEANALMASTETMMKFGFMSMSLTYFSSLNMIRAMRKVGAANTVLSNPALQGGGMAGNPMAAMAAAMGGAVGAGGAGSGMLPQAALGATGSNFRPAPRAGEATRDSRPDVSLWTVADVGAWLDTLSLGQYKDAFADAAVDGAFLFDLTDEDLRNTLGIEHALHRKKVLHAVKRLSDKERQADAARSLADAPHGFGASSGYPPQPGTVGPEGSMASSYGGGAAAPGSVDGYPSVPSLAIGGGGPGGPAPAAAAAAAAAPEDASAGALKLPDLISWSRHGKGKKLSQALRALPDRRYDLTSTRVQYVPDYGTQYEEAVARLPFHINKSDDHGNTMLHLAAQNGHLRICQFLCKKGANPNHQNAMGQTPMHFAMAYGYPHVGEWLVDPDGGAADDTLMNRDGLTPYDGISV
ncbi:hypothetical protein FNF29_05693 [Cafeteria roenbergensis]|uniref:SAM domain-containing protein n=1 Tax=Cafeteria roenbergensis TaxID=33653 RepID=A0A5A8CAL2_CAFRO|nr:hypothetical protein FNF29_05693 [Cafeteria roenbergensis]|eukprot:KAA0149868.1 hypothetical protein FNF29_05693 [Cafeteria roenbergensis]